MNAVGIDVSKGWSVITVRQSLGKVIAKPYKVLHTVTELKKLADFLKSLTGETRIIMENTGLYYQGIAKYLHEWGMFVSVVNVKCIRDFDSDSLRKVKTDKADARKIARYGIAHWEELREYTPEEDIRQQLKDYSRQYAFYSKTETRLKNNLLALLEKTFPEVRTLFSDNIRENGHEKWIDFADRFWHMECVSSLSKSKFEEQYKKWCAKNGYRYNKSAVDEIYELSKKYIAILPKDELTKVLIRQAVAQLNSTAETKAAVLRKLKEIAQSMPEWNVVIEMDGVGDILAPQLIAEIGNINRFGSKNSLTGFACVDSPPNQSGKVDKQGNPVTKSGSSYLRRTLFLVISSLLMRQPDDRVYHFIDKKRSEGKHYLVYVVAGYNKFLKVYYGKLKEYLANQSVIEP
jgi:transposase